MDESTKGVHRNRSRSPELNADRKLPMYLKVADCESRVPKRKLSVFYRSFDVIEQIGQESERETLDFRRTSSSPSVRIERPRENTRNDEIHDQQTDLHKRGLVNTYRTLIESGKFLSGSSLDCFIEEVPRSDENPAPKATSQLPPSARLKLPQVREDTVVDNYATITDTSTGKYCLLNNNGCRQYKANDERLANDSLQVNSSPDLTNVSSRSFADKTTANSETVDRAIPDATINFHRGNSPNDAARPTRSRYSSPACPDLVKIKDTVYPRSFVNASRAARLEKYTSVDGEMSSHEDSSIGSDSEDESAGRRLRPRITTRAEARIVKSKSNSPSSSFSSFTGEPQRKPDSGDQQEKIMEFCSTREKRQRIFIARRSLSEGDYERQCPVKRHCTCIKEAVSVNEQEQFPPFPSFNDTRLDAMGLSTSEDIDNVYRETIPESELERKYIAFSIGLSADRITLKRRMALYLRQRDQSERNFMYEIQKVQEGIKDLCSLCMDQESIDKVEKVRHRLDVIARSAHRISSTAESLGAVYQEHRMSRAIFLSDKYLQILRSRCENLTAEIAETKQILLRNNIVIEENSGEIGDDLPKIRYRNGLPSNRTMIARRRASIATISRPLTSQDSIKEAPRQRNSVSGRVTLRRPSLCSDTQSSANSVVELRDIFEHIESRRNSIEENNNLLRSDQCSNLVNYEATNNMEDKNRLIPKKHSFLESNVTKVVEEQLISCIRTAEPFRITRNIGTWRPILWLLFIFFLGFYARQITSTFIT
ncbi:uncharacterized protein LOC108622639 isoform X3 [Ceratina calcarata]|uniref:Uncharacterized protein LOC108622639 isoform X3 n=1 Tax=Ceratina calcarata TaxID=156304 RepID=A0AAJ7ISN1_9HYME|nr:uncharacterized protein LOC108622639 isoform X3 [Ceratina calcarata]